MRHRTLLAAIIASLAPIASSYAEPAPTKVDPLKKLLEEKYTPPPSQKPIIFDKKDFHPIVPKKDSPQQPNSGQPGRSGQLAPANDLSFALNYSATNTGARSLLYRVADNRPLPASGSFVVAQQSNPAQGPGAGAIATVYLVQLKPTATQPQIDAMLSKYNLTTMPGGLSGLHIMRLRGPPVVLGPNENVFTQKTLLGLRREPIVQGAAVDTTISTRSVPLATTTSIKSDDVNYVWSWKTTRTATNGLGAPVPNKLTDGNWGLKSIRMPPVWTILQSYRAANPNAARPKVAVFDTGFSKHEDLNFNAIRSPLEASPPSVATVSLFDPCKSGHGNHVSGIIGATYGNGLGIDGIVPQAKIDAVVALTLESQIEDETLSSSDTGSKIELFGSVLHALSKYLYDPTAAADLRVINLSLGYNVRYDGDPNSIAGHAANIATQANFFAELVRDFQDKVLFIAAAGNDSEGRTTPLDAKWSSPIVWAATEAKVLGGSLKNIIVVDASNRFGERATFSNLSKRAAVSAPGVEILSTLLPGELPSFACQGTSQAAPHVAGVAALLFELDPTKKPGDIADIILASATRPSKAPGVQIIPQSPHLDALEAVLRLSPNNLTRLADLNRDGKVDIEDMKIFATQMAMIADNRINGTKFTMDLNGDGVVDNNECNWPLIDLNGSGSASLALTDAKRVQGFYRTDLDVMALAWTDKAKDFKTALKETGLDVALQTADVPPGPISEQACR